MHLFLTLYGNLIDCLFIFFCEHASRKFISCLKLLYVTPFVTLEATLTNLKKSRNKSRRSLGENVTAMNMVNLSSEVILLVIYRTG